MPSVTKTKKKAAPAPRKVVSSSPKAAPAKVSAKRTAPARPASVVPRKTPAPSAAKAPSTKAEKTFSAAPAVLRPEPATEPLPIASVLAGQLAPALHAAVMALTDVVAPRLAQGVLAALPKGGTEVNPPPPKPLPAPPAEAIGERIDMLRKALRYAIQRPVGGRLAELARHLRVSPEVLETWLRGIEPGAEATLAMVEMLAAWQAQDEEREAALREEEEEDDAPHERPPLVRGRDDDRIVDDSIGNRASDDEPSGPSRWPL